MNDVKTVLVVDDSKLYLQLLTSKIKEKGLNTREAKDGKEALDFMIKNQPDLIVLDVVMPEMDGFAMLKELRSADWGKKVPVVMLSGLSHPKESKEALSDENLIYLVKEECKPEDIANIVEYVCQMLQYMDAIGMQTKDALQKAKSKFGLK